MLTSSIAIVYIVVASLRSDAASDNGKHSINVSFRVLGVLKVFRAGAAAAHFTRHINSGIVVRQIGALRTL